MNRLCLFSQYDPNGLLPPETRFHLEAIARAGYRVVLIASGGPLSETDRGWLDARGMGLITRANRGLDFGAWAEAMGRDGRWREADWLLLANDSVFGPLHPLDPILARLETMGADFFSMTENNQIAPHAQSYFLGLSARVIRSPAFADHFAQDFAAMDREAIIRQGEIGLTARLEAAGFTRATAFPFDRIDDGTVRGWVPWPPNVLHDHWDRLVRDFGFPYIKAEVLRDNPVEVPGTGAWRALIPAASGFSPDWIDAYLARAPRRPGPRPAWAAGLDRLPQPLPAPFGPPTQGLSIQPFTLTVDPALAERPTLNVIMGAMALRHMAGGQNTALQIAVRLARAGTRVRFLSSQAPTDADHEALYAHINAVTGIDARDRIEIGCGYDRAVPVTIGPRDGFMATAWWTAHIAKAALPQVRAKRFLYLIQDVETGFHPLDANHALALESYDLDAHAIVNQRFLLDHLRMARIGRFADPDTRAVAFEPAIERRHFHPEPAAWAARVERRLLFYARPETAPRNLYPTGLAALRLAAFRGAFSDADWRLTFIGDPLPDFALTPDLVIRHAPRLDFDRYAALMRGADLCLAPMLSPHTGYPALEAAAAGALAVTTSFATKTPQRLSALSPNILAASPTVEDLALAIERAARRVEDHAGRIAGAAIALPSTWDAAYDAIAEPLRAFWRDCLEDRIA